MVPSTPGFAPFPSRRGPWKRARTWFASAAVLGTLAPAAAARASAERAPADSTLLWVDRPLASVEVVGLVRTRPPVVLRELSARPGERVDWKRLERDRWRLLDLGLFAEVSFGARRDPAADRPVLTVTVQERPTFLAYPVLNYSPSDGWTYGAHATHINLLGTNRRGSASFLWGRKRSFALAASNPWLAGKRLGMGLRVFDSRGKEASEHIMQEQRGGEISLAPTWGPQVGFPMALGIERVRRRAQKGYPAEDLEDDTDRDHRWGAAGVAWDTREYRDRPLDGGLCAISLTQHGGPLGGNTRMTRTSVSLARVLPTGKGSALTVASNLAVSKGRVPSFLRLHLGGVETLRGYGESEFEGESRWYGWAEERFPLVPKRTFALASGRTTIDLTLDGAVFLDGGAIWEGRALEEGRARARWGAGAGLRLLAPWFRLVSLDLASDGRKVRLSGGGGIRF